MDDPRTELLTRSDPVLGKLISAEDEDRRAEALQELIVKHVRPLLNSIIGRFRSSEPLNADEAEELESIILLRLIRRLEALAESPDDPIAQLENYVATLTYHTLYDLRRQRFPERTRLKNRLRYVLTHDPRLALWTTQRGTLAGLCEWHGREASRGSFDLASDSVTPPMQDRSRPADAVTAILATLGTPVPFDVLVRLVSELWLIMEMRLERQIMESYETPPGPLALLEGRQYMDTLWREICLLPQNQRTALLLNLREPAGSNALSLFLLLGVTTFEEMASTTVLTTQQLHDLWDSLPLDDLSIADRLGLSRQQVINLRRAARARLTRRTSHLKS